MRLDKVNMLVPDHPALIFQHRIEKHLFQQIFKAKQEYNLKFGSCIIFFRLDLSPLDHYWP